MTPPRGVLLLTADADRRQRWLAALAGTASRLWTDAAACDTELLEVVVSDGPPVDEAVPWKPRLASGEIGLIAVGANTAADVALPAEASEREVCLAVSLLCQLVRLRRERLEDHRVRSELSQLALSDPLTGLPNRRGWDSEFPRRLARAAATRQPLCLALLDLDLFKAVNDSRGHAAGDEVLRRAAAALAASVRSGDYLARLGGDEFALLLADVGKNTAAAVVQRVRATVRQRTAEVGEAVPASAGYAVADSDQTPDELFARADAALREAKNGGRDRAVAAP